MTQAPEAALDIIQGMLTQVENGNPGMMELVNKQIKEWNLKVEIHNGKLVDVSDTIEAHLNKFITVNSSMVALKTDVRKLAKTDGAVLISGETGTGKELIARALHGERDGRFFGINCAGMPEQLTESLLFGYIKGSFTGADSTRQGYMQIAKDGTLFLDEIGELSMFMQSKFLRALQEHKVTKVGSNTEEEINCRFVCATNRNLREMCATNTFRKDLYARISTFELHLLPLRDRIEDCFPIIESIKGGKEMLQAIILKRNQVRIDDLFDLSLNVRSLEQYVERYRVLGKLPNC